MADNSMKDLNNLEARESKVKIDETKKLRIGIIGCGWIGNTHLTYFSKQPDVEIVAGADLIPGKAKELLDKHGWTNAKTDYPSHKEMLDDESLKLDAVTICTYNRQHAEPAIYALKKGVHVLLEKPFTVTLDEAIECMKAEKESGKILSIGFQPRMDANMKQIKKIVQSGELGDIYYVQTGGGRRRGIPTPFGTTFIEENTAGIGALGDIGCYTLGMAAPLSAIDSVLCMGASVSGVHGFNKANDGASENKTVAVIGDSTFMHSGMTGLANIAYNGTNSTVIIVDNSITGMTGHQQNPTTGYNIKGDPATKIDLEALCHALGINRVRVVDPYDLKATEKVVMEELAVDEPSVIISRRPCALLKSVKAKPALKVDDDKCKACGACSKIGCPAITKKGKKAFVDSTLCVGCGVCTQLCAFDAIVGGNE